MPTQAPRPCSTTGCPALCYSTRCPKCQREYDSRRGSSTDRGYGHRWRAYALAFLKRNPWCATHKEQGKFIRATVVDHIRPHRGNQRLFWDPANHQPLCAECHNRKTATNDGGFGNSAPVFA